MKNTQVKIVFIVIVFICVYSVCVWITQSDFQTEMIYCINTCIKLWLTYERHVLISSKLELILINYASFNKMNSLLG